MQVFCTSAPDRAVVPCDSTALLHLKEFLNVANEDNFTILGAKLFQTLAKSFPRVGATVVYRQLEGISTGCSADAIGRLQ